MILEIVEKGDIREFEKFGNVGKVCNCKGKDDTGTISITLWNEDIDKVNQGNKVHIKNGWVGEWQGELQLSTGKFGSIEVVSTDTAATVDEALEEELLDNPPSSDKGSHILTDDEKTEEELLDKLGAEEEEVIDNSEKTEDEKAVMSEKS